MANTHYNTSLIQISKFLLPDAVKMDNDDPDDDVEVDDDEVSDDLKSTILVIF